MNEDVFSNLVNFVEEQRWVYNFPLLSSTTIERELMITGDDAIEFIMAYSAHFNVDVSRFMAGKYFQGEGGNWLEGMFDIFSKEKDVETKPELTLGHLERGTLAGRLDEEIICSQSFDSE